MYEFEIMIAVYTAAVVVVSCFLTWIGCDLTYKRKMKDKKAHEEFWEILLGNKHDAAKVYTKNVIRQLHKNKNWEVILDVYLGKAYDMGYDQAEKDLKR